MPINKSKNYNFIFGVLFFTLILTGYWFQEKERYKLSVNNSYEKSLMLATGYIENIDDLLTKVALTKDINKNISMYANIWKEASQAQNNMSMLPLNSETMSTTLNYLNEIGELSYKYMEKCIDGHEITEEELKQINQLKFYTNELSYELKNLVSYSNTTNKLFLELTNSLINVNRQFQNIQAVEYKTDIVHDINEISIGEAIEIIQTVFIEHNIEDILYIGATNIMQSDIPVYGFEVILDTKSMLAYITRTDGTPMLIINTNETKANTNRFTYSEANEIAINFLNKIGFHNMKLSYYEIYENNILLNYCTYINDVIIYTENIQVKVDLFSGEVTGLNSKNYIQNYKEREIEHPNEYINEMISPNIEVLDVRLAIILSDVLEEVLCYEVYGKSDNKEFFIYVNTDNKSIEKII